MLKQAVYALGKVFNFVVVYCIVKQIPCSLCARKMGRGSHSTCPRGIFVPLFVDSI